MPCYCLVVVACVAALIHSNCHTNVFRGAYFRAPENLLEDLKYSVDQFDARQTL